MNVLIAILTLLLLALVVLIVSGPLRRPARPADGGRQAPTPAGEAEGEQRARAAAVPPQELAAAREAKYREIRDAELDYRTGKLSREDYDAIDAELRAEALEILNRIERAEAGAPAQDADGAAARAVRPRDA